VTRAAIAPSRPPRSRSLAGWMAAGVCLSVALLSWFGYRAIRESQQSARLLLERRTSDAADLLVMALSRDMRGVEASVLASSQWTDVMLDPPYDIGNLVASAFARYPYPESFFGWRGPLTDRALVFFDRAARPPAWSSPSTPSGHFPVTTHTYPTIGPEIARRIMANRVRGGEVSAFEIQLGGVPYQFVTRLIFADPFRESLKGGFGFTVNLTWARRVYFSDLTKQVGHIGGSREGLSLSVVDETGARVTDNGPVAARGPISRRTFPLLFFDPLLVALDRPADLSRRDWTVQVQTAGTLGRSAPDSVRTLTLIVAAAAAGVLALGLALISRAVRASARLAEMRSDFVSTVTHELKAPLATIRAIGDSVATGRVTDTETLKDYAQLVVQESKRLARLFDNLLAYSRITDVTEAYHFEPLELNELVEEALRGFRSQLAGNAFDVEVDVPHHLPLVRADRTAMGLLLDNVIDNAVRYSGPSHWLRFYAEQGDGNVRIAVSDRGIGIPPHELHHVVRKFFRGRRAGSGGSGLGLAIANRIITDHGGSLTIDSAVGAGTTVSLTLPIAEEPDEDTHPRG
jgi:signal transduction histidine kinase